MHWPRRRHKARVLIEFQPRAPSAKAGWALLALACLYSADVARTYLHDEARIESMTRQLALMPAEPATSSRYAFETYRPKDIERESAFARGVITRMSLPWNDLFRALQATKTDDIELLSVEPDAETRTVRISAEARDIPAMLTYVSRLESERYFQRTGLLQQEAKKDARGGVAFVVSAAWKRP